MDKMRIKTNLSDYCKNEKLEMAEKTSKFSGKAI